MLALTLTCARACGAGMTIPSAPKKIVATAVLFVVVLLKLGPPDVAPGCGPAAPLAGEVPSTRPPPASGNSGAIPLPAGRLGAAGLRVRRAPLRGIHRPAPVAAPFDPVERTTSSVAGPTRRVAPRESQGDKRRPFASSRVFPPHEWPTKVGPRKANVPASSGWHRACTLCDMVVTRSGPAPPLGERRVREGRAKGTSASLLD